MGDKTILTSFCYLFEDIVFICFVDPDEQHHSLAGAILRDAPLLHRAFWPEWRLRYPNKAVFGFWEALSDTLRTYVLATYFVTVSLGAPLALAPRADMPYRGCLHG